MLVPALAVESLRETIGKHTCDQRRHRTELITLYPGMEFVLETDVS